MANDYFDSGDWTRLVARTLARAESVNAIVDAIVTGFDNMPDQTKANQDRTTYVVDSGAANAYVATLSPVPASYVAGLRLSVKISANNTGASTINVNGLGAKSIKRVNGDALSAGDLLQDGIADLRYDGTNFQLMNTPSEATAAAASASAAAGSAASASSSASAASSSASAAAISAAAALVSENNAAATLAGAAVKASANTFTADQTIQSTDAGAAIGPKLILDRDSASPAASDVLGGIDFLGEDSAGNDETYARIQAEILDPTSATEDGALAIYAVTAGSLASRRLRVGPGLLVGSPTGGDQGAGTVNATGYYKSGVAVPVIESYEPSTGETITAGGPLTIAHGLSAAPKLIYLELRCKAGSGGDGAYEEGDVVPIPVTGMTDSAFGYGINLTYDATNIYARYGSLATPFFLLDETSGNVFNCTNAKWELMVRAYTW